MARKKASLSRWEGAVARGDLLDKPVDLGNLFNPNTFLNAVRQQVLAPSAPCTRPGLCSIVCPFFDAK